MSELELGQLLADRLLAALLGDTPGDLGLTEATTRQDEAGCALLTVPLAAWSAVARQLRERHGFDFLDWLSAVDETDSDPAGFDLVLHVVDSTRPRRRVLLRTRLDAADPVAPSLSAVWAGVAWHERETFEMFGVRFDEFDDGSGLDLRPLLLPDGFEGTPLRKSFVLAARAVRPWPGGKEPGESHAGGPSRRKIQPPGVPDPETWGPKAEAVTAAETGADNA